MTAPQRRLLHVFATLAVGGPQRRFAQIANSLGDEFHHTLFATDGRYEALDLLDNSVPFGKLATETDPIGSGRLDILRALRRVEADKLLTYNWGSIEWAAAGRLLGRRRLHHEDGFGPEEENRQLPRRVWTRRLVLRGETPIVLPSRRLEAIARDIWKLKPQQLRYLPNGVDLTRFSARRDRAALALLGIPDAQIYVGTVAALRREKNLSRLIGAFSRALNDQDARLLIAGSGPEEARLKEVAKKSSAADRIHFVGHLEKPEAFLESLDIFALSSDTEQMPLSVLEAMACGLPIASTDVGDIKQMVAPDGTDFVSGRDLEDLARSISLLMKDENLRTNLGDVNRSQVENAFSQDEMVRQYRELYLL